MNIAELERRKTPQVYKKYKVTAEKNHLSNRDKEKPKMDYKYYICDFCHKEIKIEEKWENKTGGVFAIPLSIWPRERFKIAVHTHCFKNAMQEIEEKRNKL